MSTNRYVQNELAAILTEVDIAQSRILSFETHERIDEIRRICQELQWAINNDIAVLDSQVQANLEYRDWFKTTMDRPKSKGTTDDVLSDQAQGAKELRKWLHNR